MTLVPIIERELRSAARQEFTYYLRVIGVAGLLLATLVLLFRHGDDPSVGGQLFAGLHLTLFISIWLVVPFLTADCISQERREGTLGLLFLTPLNARDLVLAKGLIQGVRALTLWLAVLPVLSLPFLLGGVSWGEALTSALVNFSAVSLALAAGLIASSLSRIWTRVIVCAGILSAAFSIFFSLAYVWCLSCALSTPTLFLGQLLRAQFVSSWMEGFRVATDWEGCWPEIFSRFGTTARLRWLSGSAEAALFSLLVLLLAIRFVARRVRLVWREEPPSARVMWLENAFCQPILFRGFLHRWMKRRLESNPVGWLEQRSWSGRLVSWGWLGLVGFFYTALLTNNLVLTSGSSHRVMHESIIWLLGASMALSAAGSFRRERESGILELLLVSPLGEEEIILGRLRGLWAQFLPAGALLFGVWCFLTSVFGFSGFYGDGLDVKAVVYYAAGFLGLPVVGLYFSLACRSFLGALVTTIAVGLLAAPILSSFVFWVWGVPATSTQFGASDEMLLRGPLLPFQLLITSLCWFGLVVRLKRRSFPLQRSSS